MTKKEMQQGVLKNGKPLDLDLFEWDEKTNTFSSDENFLTIDCGSNCTINCGSACTINCDYACTIDCDSDCTIDCDSDCTINCGYDCTINCGSRCTIDCGSRCTIDCNSACTIDCVSECTIESKGKRTVVVRRDKYEIIELIKNQKIKLNGYGIKGYKVIKDDEKVTIKISKKSLQALKDNRIKVINDK